MGTIVTLTSTRMPEYKSKQRHMNKCKCIRERRFNWPKRKNNVMSRQQPAAESEDNTINCTYYVCVCEWVGIVLNQIMSNGVFIWQRKCVKNKRIPFELVPGWKDVWCATLMRTTRQPMHYMNRNASIIQYVLLWRCYRRDGGMLYARTNLHRFIFMGFLLNTISRSPFADNHQQRRSEQFEYAYE